jgi:hypothetical protein
VTEAEIFELMFIAGSTALTALGLFLTFTFAYLTVAYFVGSRLSKTEVLIVSGVYLIANLMVVSVAMANISAMGSFQLEIENSDVYQRILFFMDADIYLVLAPIVFLLGTLVCFFFMWGVRRAGP